MKFFKSFLLKSKKFSSNNIYNGSKNYKIIILEFGITFQIEMVLNFLDSFLGICDKILIILSDIC